MIREMDLKASVTSHVYKKYIKQFDKKIGRGSDCTVGSESYVFLLEDFLTQNYQKMQLDVTRLLARINKKKVR